MASTDGNWQRMLIDAQAVQQQYYELLPEWTIYQQHEYKYLWQNIGFAIYGPPTEDKQTITIQGQLTDANNAADVISYGDKAKKIIDIVYKKILGLNNDKSCICYGIVYNITFCTKDDPAMTEKSKNDKTDKIDTQLNQVPIFKVWKLIRNGENLPYEVSYIDTQGRIYKNWSDYKKHNMLPKCTMVLPKDGIYQLDPCFAATKEYSIVWLDVAESPACSTTSVILEHMDKASIVASIAGIGLTVAAAFTPAAPVVVGASVLSALNGVWTIGRSAGNLVNKKSHQESLTDRNALGSWLGISGSAFSLAASGGSAIITKFAQNGTNVSNASKTAYNVVLAGNLGVNSFGIGCQAYSMYENYQNGETISIVDVVSLSAHILFFGNAVLNLKSAGQLIETTQGKVLNDYKATLRSRHLRKAFNRAKRNAAQMHTDKQFENAEIIRYINRKLSFRNQTTANNFSTFTSTIVKHGRKIVINGITLLDPNHFVDALITANNIHNSCNKLATTENIYQEFTNLLKRLLTSFLLDDITTNHADFYEIFKDLAKLENGQDILTIIFLIAVAVISHCPSCKMYLYESLHFVWNYIKQCIQQAVQSFNFSMVDKDAQEEIYEFVLSLFEEMETVAEHLGPAFKKYISFIRSVLIASTSETM